LAGTATEPIWRDKEGVHREVSDQGLAQSRNEAAQAAGLAQGKRKLYRKTRDALTVSRRLPRRHLDPDSCGSLKTNPRSPNENAETPQLAVPEGAVCCEHSYSSNDLILKRRRIDTLIASEAGSSLAGRPLWQAARTEDTANPPETSSSRRRVTDRASDDALIGAVLLDEVCLSPMPVRLLYRLERR
jgi:hypothetical protein